MKITLGYAVYVVLVLVLSPSGPRESTLRVALVEFLWLLLTASKTLAMIAGDRKLLAIIHYFSPPRCNRNRVVFVVNDRGVSKVVLRTTMRDTRLYNHPSTAGVRRLRPRAHRPLGQRHPHGVLPPRWSTSERLVPTGTPVVVIYLPVVLQMPASARSLPTFTVSQVSRR
ncbi:hypothetical protein MRX96_050765 [Rhipicephalus microplus]